MIENCKGCGKRFNKSLLSTDKWKDYCLACGCRFYHEEEEERREEEESTALDERILATDKEILNFNCQIRQLKALRLEAYKRLEELKIKKAVKEAVKEEKKRKRRETNGWLPDLKKIKTEGAVDFELFNSDDGDELPSFEELFSPQNNKHVLVIDVDELDEKKINKNKK